MKYSYKLFNLLDYLRLFYFMFFDLGQLPIPEKGEQRVILVIQALLLAVVINLIVGLGVKWGGWHFDWEQMAFGIVLGLSLGVPIGVMTTKKSGIESGVMFGVCISVMSSVALGIASGLGNIVSGGIALGVAGSATLSAVCGVGISVVSSVVLSVGFGVAFSIVGLIVRAGLTASLTLAGIAYVGCCVAIAATFTTAFFVNKFIQFHSAQTDWWVGVGLLGLLSVGVGYLLNWLESWFPLSAPHPLITAAIITLVYTRLPLWLLEAVWALGVIRWSRQASTSAKCRDDIIYWLAYFDRHTILPLPGEASALRRFADKDYSVVVNATIGIATFSGHLLKSVSALHTFAQFNPLEVQQRIFDLFPSDGELFVDARDRLLRYVSYRLPAVPARAWEAEKQVHLLCNQLQSAHKRPTDESVNKNIFTAVVNTYPRVPRRSNDEPEAGKISAVLNVLHRVVHELEWVQERDPSIWHIDIFSAFYRALLYGLEAEQIAKIGTYTSTVLPDNSPPELQTALTGLNTTAATVRGYLAATSPVTRRNALLLANEQLEAIAQQVSNWREPLRLLLKLVVERWRQVLVKEGGELARTDTASPVANPYVIGNPVRGYLFVGRENILRELEELWAKEGQCSSVVLFGHRRMGKSSILQNLGDRFGAGTIIVNFNMENYGWAQNNGELLFNLALQLYDSWRDSGHNDLAEPEEAQFLNHNPYMVFNRFLTNLNRVVKGERFIITVDEFEIIEEGINEGRFDSYLLRYWRGTFQNYPWFIMAFAGLHNLEEMRRDYWNPFYGSVKSIPVSFLSPNAARRLITQPDPNFAIDYESEAVEKIIKLTNGQPYLVQLICHTLVTHFNRQTFEEGIERERWFTVEDVEAVINAPEFYRDGNAYFNGVWVQAETSEPTGQVDILKALSHTSLSLSAIANKTGLSLEQAQAVLETLKRHDVIEQRDEHYVYTVELMRRWVERREGQ
jgi:hypothetical protein